MIQNKKKNIKYIKKIIMGITLSKNHGLNPSMIKCFICGKEHSIALFGRLKEDAKAPIEIADGSICPDCQKVIDNGGVFIIEVEKQEANPYRTGKLVAIKKEAINVPNNGIMLCPKEDFEQMFGEQFKDK